MSEPRYDIVFSGNLLDGADRDAAKRQLQQHFKLSDALVERLFSGTPATIKRGVDLRTATRLRELFHQAGALAQIIEVEPLTDTESAPLSKPASPSSPPEPKPFIQPARAAVAALDLAPPGTPVDELAGPAPVATPDIDHLSLVQDPDWTLEDCVLPPLPQLLPDIDALALEPMLPAERDAGRADNLS